jgi:hypothetical protein
MGYIAHEGVRVVGFGPELLTPSSLDLPLTRLG